MSYNVIFDKTEAAAHLRALRHRVIGRDARLHELGAFADDSIAVVVVVQLPSRHRLVCAIWEGADLRATRVARVSFGAQ